MASSNSAVEDASVIRYSPLAKHPSIRSLISGASVYDTHFRKKWLDSCDEAEKIMIGQCAYKAYIAGNQVCHALAAILAISALVFGTGALPSLAVCAVWMVMQCVYSREAMRLSRAGSQITE